MNSPKKPPAAPPAYRPQPLPKVLQRKTRPIAGPALIFKSSPVRTVQLAQAPAPQRGAGSSGRTPQQLWTAFTGYDTAQQVSDITDAFLANGYTMDNALPEILKAIKKLKLDLPAHLSGRSGDGVQGNQPAEVQNWVTQLTKWAREHPRGARVAAPGERHTPEQQEERQEQKQEQKAKKAVNKAAAAKESCVAKGDHILGPKGVCKNCGQK